MKKILLNSIFALALLSLAGCYQSAGSTDAAVKTTKSNYNAKCGAGKCGECKIAMKCGTGKCGDSKKAMKCGTGKCGDAKKAIKKCGATMKCGAGKCSSAK